MAFRVQQHACCKTIGEDVIITKASSLAVPFRFCNRSRYNLYDGTGLYNLHGGATRFYTVTYSDEKCLCVGGGGVWGKKST